MDITAALWRFWGQFELNAKAIPAYQVGAVPDDAVFPYVTFSPAQAAAMSTLPMVATVWVKYNGEDSSPALAQRAAFLEAVSRAIPQEGVTLDVDGGFLVLNRGSGDFLATIVDDSDKTVLGGRVGYEVRFYTT